MCPVIVSRIVTEDAPISYWPNFFLPVPSNVSEVFAKVNSARFFPVSKEENVQRNLYLDRT